MSKIRRSALASAVLCTSGVTLAQAAAIEEIVVTAQKREQSLQDAPIAISAFSSQDLEMKGMTTVGDIGNFAPNVKATPSPSNTTAVTIAIRGSVTINPAITWEPTVGIYLDGVFIGKNLGGIFDIAELERIEVLRGPQGTLYGKNTVGGAVNLITREPTGEFGGKVRAGYGNFNYRDLYATVNTDALDMGNAGRLMFKFTGGYKERDGFYDNEPATQGPITHPFLGTDVQPNPPSSDETNALDSKIGRMDTLWDISDRLSFRYTFDYVDIDNLPTKSQLTAIDPSNTDFGAPVPPDLQKYVVDEDDNKDEVSLDGANFERSRSRSHSGFLTYDLGEFGAMGNVTLKYIANSRELEWDDSIDNDGTSFSLFHSDRFVDYEQQSHEIQWLGNTAQTDYVIGLYYFEEEADVFNPLRPMNSFFGPVQLDNEYGFDNDSQAIFGQVDWRPRIMDNRLTLTFGARWTEENKEGYINHPAPNDPAYAARADDTFTTFTPNFVASYQFTDEMNVYAKYARGWKAGGFNGESPLEESFRSGYDPEEIDSYEIGVKSRWWDNRLQFNAAAFYNQIEDMQLSIFVSGAAAASVVRNAGESTISGFEFELTALATENLMLTANYGYLDAEYDKFIDNGVDQSGQKDFPYTPRHTVNVGAEYTFLRANWGELVGRLDYSYVDDYVPYIEPTQNATSQIDGYGLINGRLSLIDIPVQQDNTLQVALWGKNLTDEEYRINTIPFGAWTESYYGDPRTFGIEAIYRY